MCGASSAGGFTFSVRGFDSEGSTRMLDTSAANVQATIKHGSWQTSASINADGKFIKGGSGFYADITLEDFQLLGASVVTPIVGLAASHGTTAHKSLKLIRCGGIGGANVSMGTSSSGSATDTRVFEGEGFAGSAQFKWRNVWTGVGYFNDEQPIDFTRFDIGEGSPPTIAAAGASTSVSIRNTVGATNPKSNDFDGSIALTTAALLAADVSAADVTFANARANPVVVMLFPLNAAAAEAQPWTLTPATTGFSVAFHNPPAGATAMLVGYSVRR